MRLRLYARIAATVLLFALTIQTSAQRLIPALISEGQLYERLQWSSDLWVEDDNVETVVGLSELNGELLLFRYNTPSGESMTVTYDGLQLQETNSLIASEESVYRAIRVREIGDSLFVCGFTLGSDAQAVHFHDGSTWNSLPQVNLSRLYDFAFFEGQLYVAGRSVDSGSGIFKWNGETWEAPEVTINEDVLSLLSFDGVLYAGGDFTEINGESINYFASYDGLNWSQVGSGLDNEPTCITKYLDELLVVGNFESNGDGNSLPGAAILEGDELVSPGWEDIPENGFQFVKDALVYEDLLVIKTGGPFQAPVVESWRINNNRVYKQGLPWSDIAAAGDELFVCVPLPNQSSLHYYANSRLFKADLNASTAAWQENDKLSVKTRTLGSLFETELGSAGFSSKEIEENQDNSLLGSLVYAAGLWYSAEDDGNLYAVNPQYDDEDAVHDGTELYFGPYSECYDEDYLKRYFRTWEVTREMVDNHEASFDNPDYTAPEVILNFPATGRPWCDESSLLAPFNDLNENGLYEPSQGETPIVHGDKSIFVFMHDRLMAEETSPGFEALIEAYLFDTQDEQQARTVYLNMSVRNRSDRDYEEVKLGFWTDLDVGSSFDDRVGCSPEGDYFYGYNGLASDAGGSGSGSFAENVPAVGVVFLNNPLESFISFNNLGPTGAPFNISGIDNTLSGNWQSGESILIGGNGHPSGGAWDPPEETNYVFPDFPFEEGGDTWNELTANIPSGDRRVLGATSVGPLDDRNSVCFDLALVAAFPENANDLYSEVAVLDAAIPGVLSAYINENEECTWQNTPINVEEIKPGNVNIFPNPTGGVLNIQSDQAGRALFELYDMQGRIICAGQLNGRQSTVNLSTVPSGLYLLSIRSENSSSTHRVVVR